MERAYFLRPPPRAGAWGNLFTGAVERKGGKIEAGRHGRAGGEVDVSKNGEHAVVDSAAARARRKVDTLTSVSAALVPVQRPHLVEVWRIAEASCRAIAVQRARSLNAVLQHSRSRFIQLGQRKERNG